jgi:hypothetical protein
VGNKVFIKHAGMISVKKVLIQDKLFKNILNVEKDGN